jgi:acetoin utilization deacetylase AcuC-like enzyme
VRPPGHHATRDQSMGFCIFNNVAVGVAHALAQHGLQRVAIVDFDVHHGNGTEAIFHDDPRVMLCSTFQHPFYPHSGAGSGNEHIINVPLPAGTDGAGFRAAFMARCLPALEQFAPEMLFISAGFDAHREDDMAMLNLTEADYTWVTPMAASFPPWRAATPCPLWVAAPPPISGCWRDYESGTNSNPSSRNPGYIVETRYPIAIKKETTWIRARKCKKFWITWPSNVMN